MILQHILMHLILIKKKVYANRESNLVLRITWISIKGGNGECFNVMFKFAVQLDQIIDGAGSCQKL